MSPTPAGPLTARLAALASAVPRGSRVADIGTDHGRLPLWLARTGRVRFCLATERDAARLERVRRPPEGADWARRLAYRAGDGLAAIRDTEAVDTLVLAGLGARTIVGILGAPRRVPPSVRRLVLQPRTEPAAVRRWLAGNGWRPVSERLTEEGASAYVTIAAERGDDGAVYRHPTLDRDDLFAAGPLLVRDRPAELGRHWRAQRRRLEAIVLAGAGPGRERARAALGRAERILAAISPRAG